MDRRHFLLGSFALLVAAAPALAAAPFEPTRFSVELTGEGPDVLLIPGLTAGRGTWRSTAAAVSGYRYHLLQVAGFAGEPARGNGSGAILSPLADEIIRYIEDRGLRRPAIVGHSMGGTLTMMIAARRPDLVGRIMVVDMLPQPAGLFGQSAEGIGPLADSLGNFAGTPGGRRLFGALMNAFSPPNAANRDSDPDVVGRAMRELATTDLTPRLSRIRAPMTVVYASPDEATRASIDRTFEDAYESAANAHLVRIDGSGHMIMFDQPTRFRDEVRAFLSR
ncbi:MAG TPA: alpha/beta hydrolase [Allosphingosinicella sp.]|nr:alpha/beta hydrolase [Allosphingosinicella sp.]